MLHKSCECCWPTLSVFKIVLRILSKYLYIYCALTHASSQVNLQSFDSCFVIIDSHVVNGLPFVSFLWHMLVPFSLVCLQVVL